MNNTWSAAPLPPLPPPLPPPLLLPLPPRPPLPLPRRRRPPLPLPPSGQAPPSSVSCPPCRGLGAPGGGGTRATSRRVGPAARGGRRRGEGAAAGAEEEAGWREGCPSRESILRPPPPPRPLSRSPRHPARQTIRCNKHNCTRYASMDMSDNGVSSVCHKPPHLVALVLQVHHLLRLALLAVGR